MGTRTYGAPMAGHDEGVFYEEPSELPGFVVPPRLRLPDGYTYGATRYADIVLESAFPEHFEDLENALWSLTVPFEAVAKGGGNRSEIAASFDGSLAERGWGKRTIEIQKLVDGYPVMAVRGHEIDMFKPGFRDDPYPGVGVEMEWNNKDPFFDRDLNNFAALHREGIIGVGIIVTRGPDLHHWLRAEVEGGPQKYGASTTWWDKLVPRVNLGGGGECPLLLIGIGVERMR